MLSSKSLLPSHNDAKVVNFFHPDFSTPSHRAASLGWEKGLMQAPPDEPLIIKLWKEKYPMETGVDYDDDVSVWQNVPNGWWLNHNACKCHRQWYWRDPYPC